MNVFPISFLRLGLMAHLFLLITLGNSRNLFCSLAQFKTHVHDTQLTEQEQGEIEQYLDSEIVVLVNQLASAAGTPESLDVQARLLRKLLVKAKSEAEQRQRIREETESAAEIGRRIRNLTKLIEDLPTRGLNGNK